MSFWTWGAIAIALISGIYAANFGMKKKNSKD